MSDPTKWEVRIVRSINAAPHDFPIEIDICTVGQLVAPKPFVTTGQEFNWRLDTDGIFVTLQRTIESLADEVKAAFAVWAATRDIDDLIVVRPFPDDLPPHRYVRIATTTAGKLRWDVDPTDLHKPYGGSTTDPPLLRGSGGERRGLVTPSLIDQALDEADVRSVPVGIIRDGGSASEYRLSWGQDLADAPREMIVFLTNPPGDRSFFDYKI